MEPGHQTVGNQMHASGLRVEDRQTIFMDGQQRMSMCLCECREDNTSRMGGA